MVFSKFVTSVTEIGLVATLGRVQAWSNARLWRVTRALKVKLDRSFDLRYGIDTAELIEVQDLYSNADRRNQAQRYEPTPVSAVRTMLKSLRIDHSQFTFVDYGSGKGRVLLLASEYPWKRIVGVELSEGLHRTAEQNIRKWKSRRQRCHDIQSLCMDACKFRLPEGPMALFFFTPFRSPISDQVIGGISDSIRASPRPLVVLYYGSNQEFQNVLERLQLPKQEIYARHPWTAQSSRYKGVLWSNIGLMVSRAGDAVRNSVD